MDIWIYSIPTHPMRLMISPQPSDIWAFPLLKMGNFLIPENTERFPGRTSYKLMSEEVFVSENKILHLQGGPLLKSGYRWFLWMCLFFFHGFSVQIFQFSASKCVQPPFKTRVPGWGCSLELQVDVPQKRRWKHERTGAVYIFVWKSWSFFQGWCCLLALRIQVCPKKGIIPTFLF